MQFFDSLLNHPVISERYFFPRPARLSRSRDFIASDKAVLRCFEHRHREDAKTLVHFHGNGEVVNDYIPDYTDAIAALGVNLLMVEYRGYGGSDGTPELARMLDDVRAVREQCRLAPEQTVVYGRSVGAIFAVEWASQAPEIAGLILESGVADPLQRLSIRLSPSELGVSANELEAACRERLDHRRKLSGYFGPLLLLHAEDDSLVTIEHAHMHQEWAGSRLKEAVFFERGDHNGIIAQNWSAYLAAIEGFLGQL